MAGASFALFSALPIITGAITVLDCFAANQARRLYNGILEGEPRIATDLYGATLVLHNYADPPVKGDLLRRRLRNPKNTWCVEGSLNRCRIGISIVVVNADRRELHVIEGTRMKED